MGIQASCEDFVISKRKNIDEKRVIFVDAHHTCVPFSMEKMRDTFIDSDYTVIEIYNNYQTSY